MGVWRGQGRGWAGKLYDLLAPGLWRRRGVWAWEWRGNHVPVRNRKADQVLETSDISFGVTTRGSEFDDIDTKTDGSGRMELLRT
jgi:hypothetical protein